MDLLAGTSKQLLLLVNRSPQQTWGVFIAIICDLKWHISKFS